MPMEQDRGAEEEDAPAPYMPIVPQGMSTSAPAPQVATLLQYRNMAIFGECKNCENLGAMFSILS